MHLLRGTQEWPPYLDLQHGSANGLKLRPAERLGVNNAQKASSRQGVKLHSPSLHNGPGVSILLNNETAVQSWSPTFTCNTALSNIQWAGLYRSGRALWRINGYFQYKALSADTEIFQHLLMMWPRRPSVTASHSSPESPSLVLGLDAGTCHLEITGTLNYDAKLEWFMLLGCC